MKLPSEKTLSWLIAAIVVAIVVVFVLMLAGCKSAPVIPTYNTVVVEKFKPLPAWADEPVAKPVLPDTTVGGHATQENALDAWFDYFACVRGLLRRLDAGHAVAIAECPQPKAKAP